MIHVNPYKRIQYQGNYEWMFIIIDLSRVEDIDRNASIW